MDYANFDLTLEAAPDGGYLARVKGRGGAEDAVSAFPVPVSPVELENLVLRIGRLRSSTRRIESPEMEATKAIGGRLHDALFSGPIGQRFRHELEASAGVGAGLRIRLNLQAAPGLLDLPWEYLYDPARNTFLTLSQKTPLVRYIDLGHTPALADVAPPLRVLVMIADTSEEGKLDVEREWSLLKDALEPLRETGLVEVDRLAEATLPALTRQLLRSHYQIFHFIGHGGFDERKQDGTLMLEGRSGRPNPVSGQDLGMLLQDHDTLRLAVLNACDGARTSSADPFAGVAQSLVQQGLPAVIAMQFEITDDAAILFASEFYGALADGRPVDTALSAARRMIYANGNRLEWGTPVLYTRIPDGSLFRVARPGESDSTAPVPEDEASDVELKDAIEAEPSDTPVEVLPEDDPSKLELPQEEEVAPSMEDSEAVRRIPAEAEEPERGGDLRAELSLTWDEAREGGAKTLKADGLTRKIQYPAEVADGQEILLPKRGRPGRNGGPPGDLIVTAKVAPPEPLRGHNKRTTLTLMAAEAAQGGTKPLMDGGDSLDVSYRAGTKDGETATFPGRGEPGQFGGDNGDLIVTLKLKPPDTNWREAALGLGVMLATIIALLYGLVFVVAHAGQWKDAALVKLGIVKPDPVPHLSYDPKKLYPAAGGNTLGGLNPPLTLDKTRSILNNPGLNGIHSLGSTTGTTTGTSATSILENLPSSKKPSLYNESDKWFRVDPKSSSTSTGGLTGISSTTGITGRVDPLTVPTQSREADRVLREYFNRKSGGHSSGGNTIASPNDWVFQTPKSTKPPASAKK